MMPLLSVPSMVLSPRCIASVVTEHSHASNPAIPATGILGKLDKLETAVGVMMQSIPKFEQGGSISPSAASKDVEKTRHLLCRLGLSHKPTLQKGKDGRCVP